MKRLLCALLFTVYIRSAAQADVAVLTQHNDLSRTGANLKETFLNTNNVNTNQFGLVYTRTVDDQIYAQPLVMTNVTIPGKGVHNIVYVATVNDTVYAFDADDPGVTSAYWQTNFLNANAVAVRNSDMTGACSGAYVDFSGACGIVSTPVIDPVAGTIYVLVRTKENGSTFVQRLHALNITNGTERANSPVVIAATYPGNGEGGSTITFNPQKQNQRSAITLANGIVYLAWASHCDWGPYHGWLMGFDATTLQRVCIYNTSPNGYNAGIWMSGQGPAVDASGNLYLSVGNGMVGVSGNPGNTINRGESFLKLTRSGTNMTLASWFTPYNWQDLENGDVDLGSAGILLIPGTTLAFSGGKQGKVYLVNRDNMGGLSGNGISDTNIVQSFQVTGSTGKDNIHGAPIWWDGPDGSYSYVWGETDYLRQYKFDRVAGKFLLPNYATSPTAAPFGMPGGMLSISANSTNAGSGILWASHQYSGDANNQVRPGILHAYDAQNVSHELWNSKLVARDDVGNFAKFCPPTIANGKVYLATFSSRLNVYGLFPPGVKITSPTNNASFTTPGTFSVIASATAAVTNRPIATVDFFDNTALLGTVSNAPYSFSVTNLPVGSHSLIAKATDSAGAFSNSVPVIITITPAPVLSVALSNNNVIITWPTNNASGFTLKSENTLGAPGTWTTVTPAPTLVGTNNRITLPTTNQATFYRLSKP